MRPAMRCVIARTHARVSRSCVSPVVGSFTARASEARTEADSTSYCCAPAKAAAAAPMSAAASTQASMRRVALRMLEAGLHVRDRLGERHLRRGGIAPMLVLDHAFLEAAVAHDDAVRDADELLVGEQH